MGAERVHQIISDSAIALSLIVTFLGVLGIVASVTPKLHSWFAGLCRK